MTNDRRAVLESIAYGDDPKLTPSDRLRALELLREMDTPDDKATLALPREVEAMPDDALADELKGYSPPELNRDDVRTLARSLARREVRRRTKELEEHLRELEANIERRAQKLADEKVATLMLREAEQAASEEPRPRPLAPPGISPEDAGRAWPSGRP